MSEKIIPFLLLASLVSLNAQAASLKVTVKGSYAVRTTEVSKEQKNWICKTEENPRVTRTSRPYSETLLAKIPPSKKSDCKDFVLIRDLEKKPAKVYAGCADEKSIAAFLNDLDQNCRHNL